MKFIGTDLLVWSYEFSITVVCKDVIPEEQLRKAASRLLESWPTISFRVNCTRSKAYETPAKSIDHGFLNLRSLDRFILPQLAPRELAGFNVYDATILNKLFKNNARQSLKDRFCPRIFVIDAASLQDATVMRFTLQHAAGEALSLHSAATAFCECLFGNTGIRTATGARHYAAARDAETKDQQTVPTLSVVRGRIFQTSQAAIWWEACTSSKFFPVRLLANKWSNHWRYGSRLQMVHIPEKFLEQWRSTANCAGAKVTLFDLFASWIQMKLADYAHEIDPSTKARLIITVSVRRSLQSPQEREPELWNPVTLAMIKPATFDHLTQQQRLIQGAISIREHIQEVRDPAYIQDYTALMSQAPRRQCQVKGVGGRTPVTMLLTSWSHAPFENLQVCTKSSDDSGPVLVQPQMNVIHSLPIPRGLDRQCAICWRGKAGGYWFTANLEDRLWERILDLSSSS